MKPAVVVITRNRVDELMRTLQHLVDLDEAGEIVVVDNASDDGTTAMVRTRFPDVRSLRAAINLGSAARNVGLNAVASPYVAFSDDDTMWEPGSLTHAARLLDRHAGVGLVAARVIVGADRHEDDACRAMENSPLDGRADLPGPRVLGFLACAAVVRRVAFQDAGGFHPAMMIGGEEELL